MSDSVQRALYRTALLIGTYGLLGSPAAAAILPQPAGRSLPVDADVIIVGEPLDVTNQGIASKFRVVEVYKGNALLPGDEIVLSDGPFDDDGFVLGVKSTQPVSSRTLLFLNVSPNGRPVPQFPSFGSDAVHFDVLGRNRRISPAPNLAPGEFHVNDGADWIQSWVESRRDVPVIAKLSELAEELNRDPRSCSPFHRFEEHGLVAAPNVRNASQTGWRVVNSHFLKWVVARCRAEEHWPAVLYADEPPYLKSAFGVKPRRVSPVWVDERYLNFTTKRALGVSSSEELHGYRRQIDRERRPQSNTLPLVSEQFRQSARRRSNSFEHPTPAWRLSAVTVVDAVEMPAQCESIVAADLTLRTWTPDELGKIDSDTKLRICSALDRLMRGTGKRLAD